MPVPKAVRKFIVTLQSRTTHPKSQKIPMFAFSWAVHSTTFVQKIATIASVFRDALQFVITAAPSAKIPTCPFSVATQSTITPPNGQSILGYQNPAAEWIFVLFIFLAGANYSLQYRALRGRPMALFRDEEFRWYTILVVGATLLLAGVLLPFAQEPR